MRYVDEKSNKLARDMEKRLSKLPPEAGVLFVAVQAQPEEGGRCREFFVRLGLRRDLEESTGKALVQHVFADELADGLKISAGVYRGVSGTAREPGAPAARPVAS